MAIRMGGDINKLLFISVKDAGGTNTVFTFHKNKSNKARQLVTLLPIMLEHKYGAQIWTWLMGNAKVK
jgi:hypothetical protein